MNRRDFARSLLGLLLGGPGLPYVGQQTIVTPKTDATAASAVIPPFSTIGWTQIFVPNVVHKSLQTVGRSDKLAASS